MCECLLLCAGLASASGGDGRPSSFSVGSCASTITGAGAGVGVCASARSSRSRASRSRRSERDSLCGDVSGVLDGESNVRAWRGEWGGDAIGASARGARSRSRSGRGGFARVAVRRALEGVDGRDWRLWRDWRDCEWRWRVEDEEGDGVDGDVWANFPVALVLELNLGDREVRGGDMGYYLLAISYQSPRVCDSDSDSDSARRV